MSVLRLVGLVSLVAALAIGGLTFKLGGSGSSGGSNLPAQIDRAFFTGADASLAAYRAGSGTFAGAPAIPGVTVVRADAESYCIEAVQGTAVEHEVGPAGQVQPGHC